MQTEKYTLRKFTPCSDSKFSLTKKQMGMLNEWLKDVEQRAAVIQVEKIKHLSEGSEGVAKDYYKSLCAQNDLPHYGTLGGGLTFTFEPCGIGVSCEVTEAITGESIDLTDLDEW